MFDIWLYLGGLPDLLPDADELVGLHREGVEPDVGRIDAHIGQLKYIRHEHESSINIYFYEWCLQREVQN